MGSAMILCITQSQYYQEESSGKQDRIQLRSSCTFKTSLTMKRYFVYILTNQRHTTLYTGLTNSVERRIPEHKNKKNKRSFSARYNLNKLVYFEGHKSIKMAIRREKYIKNKGRAYKIKLIMTMNPFWLDLFEEFEYDMSEN